ncbi:MAG: hypothetical protein Q8L26_08420 [Candidatus Omnitrophota bacterium]|nr:hypothetical protein [Candidatus Omnitrophota bacterium]
MKRNERQEKIETAAALLMQASSPKKAIAFRDLCLFAMVSEPEAYVAVKYAEKMGYRIRLTDDFPRKLYTIHG